MGDKSRCLAICYPQIAKEWNYEKNGGLTPFEVTCKSHKKVWWHLSYDDPITGKHFEFEWQAPISYRTREGSGCPYLSGKAVWPGYNDLLSRFPEIASEWNFVRNVDLLPSEVSYGSEKKVWWLLSYDDPITGKHFEFEWKETVNNRTNKGYGCPYISGKAVWQGYNDLASRFPEIANEWDYEKNGSLKPSDITYSSGKKVWWVLLFDDPVTRKQFKFEWQAAVSRRTVGGEGCPYLLGRAVWQGYNDLQSRFPAIANEWDYEKNGGLSPTDVTYFSSKKVWWHLSYDDSITGKRFEFTWEAEINERTKGRGGCPYLSGRKVWRGYNDLETRFPEVSKQWHPTKNGKLKPSDVAWGSDKIVWWEYLYDDPITGKRFAFEWKDRIGNRTRKGYGCPYISGKKVWRGYNDLLTKVPVLGKEWHEVKNRKLRPDMVTASSGKKVWWKCEESHEWKAQICQRVIWGTSCPYCVRTHPKKGETD